VVGIYAKNPLSFLLASFQPHPIPLSLSCLSSLLHRVDCNGGHGFKHGEFIRAPAQAAGPSTDLLPGLRMEEGDGANVSYKHKP
jgi:hypothetical protein